MRLPTMRLGCPPNGLPAERAARRLEVLHEPAWRDLLDLVPGATQALADLAAARTGTTATGRARNTAVRFTGGCGSDLFLACAECDADRAVFEI
jgi:hypothetical protein